MRAVHQTPPPVASSVTRSPSRVSFPRNSATAALACCAVAGPRWTSSKTITNVRPRCSCGVGVRREPGGAGAAGAAGAGGAGGAEPAAHLEQVEARDRLADAVLVDLQVLALQVGDRLPLPVGHDHVHRDLLDLGGEGGSGPLGLWGWRLRARRESSEGAVERAAAMA